MPGSHLTICSVSFRSAHFLGLNRRLTAALNPHPLPAWIVVDNTPTAERTVAESDASDFTVLPGVPPPHGLPEKVTGSYHHAAALQAALPHVQTRYALILDPDFFVVRPGWVRLALDHMERRGLAFFGVPWHPRWFVKYRSFPCVHCMFIDLSQVKKAALDFSPQQLAGGRAHAVHKQFVRKIPRPLAPLYLAGRKVFLTATQAGRWQIGRTADTGAMIHHRFGHDATARSETALPVFDEDNDALAPAHARSRVARRLERLLPPHLRYYPEPGSFTRAGFAERGFPGARSLGCEEFIWQDQPFGFHFRGTAQTAEKRAAREAALADLIESFRAHAAANC